eukprot:scaffold208419_cov24-Tisochrysis_lutea.AAC.5
MASPAILRGTRTVSDQARRARSTCLGPHRYARREAPTSGLEWRGALRWHTKRCATPRSPRHSSREGRSSLRSR